MARIICIINAERTILKQCERVNQHKQIQKLSLILLTTTHNYDGIPNYLHAPLGDVIDFADDNKGVADLDGDLNEQLPFGNLMLILCLTMRGMEGN